MAQAKKKSTPKSGAKPQSKSIRSTELDSEPFRRIFARQQTKALQLRTSSARERIDRLKHLLAAVEKHQTAIQSALAEDFQKSPVETDMTEILPTLAEGRDAIRNLRSWMKPLRVKTPITLFGASSQIHYQPRGTTLIISPWNYPFHLAMAPIIAAISAGNTVILKPSEFTPATSKITKRIFGEVFAEDEVAVFEGDYRVSEALTDLPFDHIFFTGSTAVGKIIMQKAAKHLTTVTLELGGKSPAILTKTCDIAQAARSLIWGKFLNAGQTCVAPDYVLLPENLVPMFVQETRKAKEAFFAQSPEPHTSPDYCRIINSRNFDRVQGYIQDALDRGAKIEWGGTARPADRFLEPTLLSGVTDGAKILEEEIFGPVLPLIPYDTLESAIRFVNARPKPLALYIFSKDESEIQTILGSTSSGGALVNDVILHLANPHLPFGGVNHSGHGSYHGYFGFKAFSHERAVLRQAPFSAIRWMYPPYTKWVRKLVDTTTRYLV